jgi:hypothetical protein
VPVTWQRRDSSAARFRWLAAMSQQRPHCLAFAFRASLIWRFPALMNRSPVPRVSPPGNSGRRRWSGCGDDVAQGAGGGGAVAVAASSSAVCASSSAVCAAWRAATASAAAVAGSRAASGISQPGGHDLQIPPGRDVGTDTQLWDTSAAAALQVRPPWRGCVEIGRYSDTHPFPEGASGPTGRNYERFLYARSSADAPLRSLESALRPNSHPNTKVTTSFEFVTFMPAVRGTALCGRRGT